MGAVAHRAELKAPERKQSIGADAALAALQNSLASYHQEKAAKSVTVTNSLIGTPKNRFEANRDQKHAHRRGLSGSQHASPTISASGTPRLGAAPTSMPSNDSALRLKAMKKPLIHLLAIEPLSQEEIIQKTRIPKADLEEILSKIGKQAEGKKMGLSDRAYKELDVFNFGYSTPEERQAAIDNAVRAYDRQRIPKEEKIWQMLLPEERRNKGEYLSKLQLGGQPHLTPNVGASPLVHGGDGDERAGGGSVAGTPRLGPGTPKVASGKSDFMKKLAKNPKQRAIDDAKDKKRKEREAAKVESDREGRPAKKPRTTAPSAKNSSKIKSAELVQSSSEDEMSTIRSSQPKAPPAKREPLTNATNASAKAKSRPTVSASTSSSDAPDKRSQSKATSTPLAKSSKVGTASARPTSTAANAKSKTVPPGKSTPNGLHAPAAQQRSQLSPNTSKPHHRPTAPSPLGAARPRVASDVSDRAAIGIQRARPGADTPKGLGISNANGIRKRHDTMTSTSSSNSDKLSTNNQVRNAPMTNGTGRSAVSNGLKHKTENGTKRKAMDTPQHENGSHPSKHRKTESSSSHSQNSISAGSSNSDHDRPSFASSLDGVRINFGHGVNLARKFREEWYPAYMKLYDELEAIQRRGERMPPADKERLLQMHERLVVAKREIADASEREHET